MRNPNTIEKELFPVIVHEDQFVVPARRIHHLLQEPQPFKEWFQKTVFLKALTEGKDYYYRKEGYVFNLFAVQKLTALEYAEDPDSPDNPARTLFQYCTAMEHHLLHVANKTFNQFLVKNLHWKDQGGMRLYRLSSVLKGVQQQNAEHLQQVYPRHFTRIGQITYISYELTQLLYLKKWTSETDTFVMDINPFKGLGALA